MSISATEALTLRNSYDKFGSGEMEYMSFVKEMDLEDPHFLAQASGSSSSGAGGGAPSNEREHATSRTPPHVALVVARFRRAVEIYTRKSGNVVASRDVLYGTCLRNDTARSGRLTQDQLIAVAAELGVPIRSAEVAALIEWFDSSSSRTLDYRSLVRQIYGGDDALTRALTLPKLGRKAGNALYNTTVTYATAGNTDHDDDNASVNSNSNGSFKVVTSTPFTLRSGAAALPGDKSMEAIESKKDKAARLLAKRGLVLREREVVVAKLAALDAAKKRLQADHSARRARENAAKTREDHAVHLQHMAAAHLVRKQEGGPKK